MNQTELAGQRQAAGDQLARACAIAAPVARQPPQAAGTYDLYVLTPENPGLCIPPLTLYVIPGAMSYGG